MIAAADRGRYCSAVLGDYIKNEWIPAAIEIEAGTACPEDRRIHSCGGSA